MANRPLKLDDIRPPDLSEGENPFAEDVAVGEEADVHAPADYRGAYETVSRSTGILLIIMALLGLTASAMPMLGFVWGDIGVALGFFGWLVGWLLALPTLVFAANDQKAIRLGRMTSRGQWLVHISFWLALLTLAILVGTVAGYLFLGFD
ncbi:hypothetical protein [Bremerella cremea]|uniref:hypothetical protein n=1 Tax=Bremerella cremea TaxID=1031537 RepID=UPI0031F1B7D5